MEKKESLGLRQKDMRQKAGTNPLHPKSFSTNFSEFPKTKSFSAQTISLTECRTRHRAGLCGTK